MRADGPVGLTEIVGCSESADSTTNDNQIKFFASVDGLGRVLPESVVAKLMRCLEAGVGAAAESGKRRRIVPGRILRERGTVKNRAERIGDDRCSDDERRTVQKIAASNVGFHSEFAIARVVHGASSLAFLRGSENQVCCLRGLRTAHAQAIPEQNHCE